METLPPIKGYEIQERIGSGGFGVVYRAFQTTLGREVAIKIILPHFANHPDFIRRFETEARTVARLEHPHIVPLYDFWRDPEGAYLVMRWLRGGSLHSALEQGPYDLEATALFVDQIASALALAHRNGIVHRDLKPANILLDDEGNAYLSDFGIAKDIASSKRIQTETGVVVGSPNYLSPEQARRDPITPQADIYSFGVVVYEILTGQHPFPNLTPVERMYRHLNEPLPSIESLSPEISKDINEIIQKATAKNPAHRYPEVLEMAADFRRVAAINKTQGRESLVEQLTLREHEILRLIIQGCSNREIAQQLFVTVGTVKWYIRQIYQKLRVRSRVQAIVRAQELHLIGTEMADRLPSSTEITYVPMSEPENPYKGLRAFQTADARDFFGREILIKKIITRLNEKGRLTRFLAVIGPSGSGKSSLLKAGVVPALWRGELPGSDRWFIVDITPGANPLDELEIALARIATDTSYNMHEQLARDQRGLVRAANLILPDDGSELLIIIDQFEEIFTLVEKEADRAHFLSLLYTASIDPRSRLRIIITLRADFYDRPLHYVDFGELIRSRMETVLPLSADELEAAITKPAERVGVAFEPGMVSQIISEVHYQPGALPLLQYALTELFEQRSERTLTHSAYQMLGGVVGALAKRADEIYGEQTQEGRDAIHQMFLRLVTPGEAVAETRRRAFRSELLDIASDKDRMDEVIDTYVAYRLLTLDYDPATRKPIVEIAHEAILHEWERLRVWLDESRHDILQQHLLTSAATEWLQAGKETSYLLRGSRLEQFGHWATETSLVLAPYEREFLATSLAQQKQETTSERERQARELALARQAEIAQRRAATRLRYLVVGLLIFLTMVLGLSLFAFGQRDQAQADRATSEVNARIALKRASQVQELALVNGAQAALAQDDPETALALAIAANSLSQPSGQAQRTLSEAVYRPGVVRHFQGQTANALSITVSPDGKMIFSGGVDNLAYIWDAASGQLLHRLEGHLDWVVDVGISPDNRTGFTLSRDRNIILWDLTTGLEIRRFGSDLILTPEALSATFSPDGRYILSNNGALPGRFPEQEAMLILWEVDTGQPIRTFRGHRGGIGGIAMSPDGQKVLSGGFMGEMILWDMQSGDILNQFSEHSNDWRKMPSDIAFSLDGQTAYAKGMDGVVVVWDLDTFMPRYHLGQAYENDSWAWTQLAISPDGHWLSSTSSDNHLHVWDIQTGTEIISLPDRGLATAFSPDGQFLLSDTLSELHLWDLTNGAEIHSFETVFPIAGIALSPDGSALFVASGTVMGSDNPICNFVIFDVATGQIRHDFELKGNETDTLGCVLWSQPTFSPDGRLVLAGVDERVMMWDVNTGNRLPTFNGHSASISSLALSPDGRTVLSGDVNGQVILWDLTTTREIRRLGLHESAILDIAFSPEQATALTSSADGKVILWNLITGEVSQLLEGTRGSVLSVSWSPDGQKIAACDESGQITLWEAVTVKFIQRFAAPACKNALFTMDDRYLLTGDMVLWDIAEEEAIRQYPQGYYPVLSPDGNSFFSVTPFSKTIVQWRIDSLDELMRWASNHRYVRELSCGERSLYQIEPTCNELEVFPTRTPYLTAYPTTTPVPKVVMSAATIVTTTPTVTPYPIKFARIGENRGEVNVSDHEIWQYMGKAGEILTIRVNADQPANWGRQDSQATSLLDVLDTLVIVTAPDGRDLNIYNSGGGMIYDPPQSNDIEPEINTDSFLDGLVLPMSGPYQIIISGSGYRTGGKYTLIIESKQGFTP